MPTEVHDCDRSTWCGAPGDQRICPECHQVWVALDAGPLDIRWERLWEHGGDRGLFGDVYPSDTASAGQLLMYGEHGWEPVTPEHDDAQQAIFGVSDGLTSALGVVIPLAVAHRPISLVIFGLAICAAIGMGGGEYLSDRAGRLRSALFMAVASFVGTLIPAVPFLLLPYGIAGFISAGLVLVTVLAISEVKARDTTGVNRDTKRVAAYGQTVGILLLAGGATTVYALLTGASG